MKPPSIPFVDLLTPAAREAERRLMAEARTGLGLLAPVAREALRAELLNRLSRLAAPVLLKEFRSYRRRHGWRPSDPDASMPRPTALYEQFVDETRPRMSRLLAGYSVLDRLLRCCAQQWVDSTAEFLGRFSNDLSLLTTTFGQGGQPAGIEWIRTGLSDPHRGGRSVLILELSSGDRLVYKPRSLGMEASYYSLIDWLNGRGAPCRLRVLRILDRGTYGWMEFADNGPCREAAEVARYYMHAGAVLCLVYVLGGVDFHLENVVASGPDPVLVDLETVLQPALHNRHEGERRIRADLFQRVFGDTVLGTGLLPVWQSSASGTGFDPSGFTGATGQGQQGWGVAWVHTNTDDMDRRSQPTKVRPGQNIPRLDGSACDMRGHVGSFMSGFREMYDFLLVHRDALVSADGPVERFRDHPVRFLFRPSAIYARIQEAASRPSRLQDGRLRSAELDRTAQAFRSAAAPDLLWPLQQGERNALEQLDIPYFAVAAADSGIEVGEHRIERCFAASAFRRAVDRLDRLGPDDLERQLRIIGTACALRYREGGAALPRPPSPGNGDGAVPWVTHATYLAVELAASRLEMEDRGVTWPAIERLDDAGRYRLRASSYGLDGAAGTALFLAALASVTGEAGHGRLALDALRPLRELAATPEGARELVAATGLGAVDGYGSILYGMAWTSLLLEEPDLLRDGRALALAVPFIGPGPDDMSVGNGAAGAVLGLLALYDCTGDPELLEIACGLGRRIVQGAAGVVDRTRRPELLHGAAGVEYALARLRAATTEARCGATGRAGAAWRPSPDSATLTATLRMPRLPAREGPDTLAAGNLGAADLLLELGHRRGRPALVDAAHRRARWAMDRATRTGGYRLFGSGPEGLVVPGLFTGSAGIGYALLRMAAPHRLPCALLWSRARRLPGADR